MGDIDNLPEAEQGDIAYILNKLPNSWDLRTDFARGIAEKMRDLLIDEVNEVLDKAFVDKVNENLGWRMKNE